MHATKGHHLWETGLLDPALESLLQEYTRSIGTDHGGIPYDIFQGASQIAKEHAFVTQSGPADCVEESTDDASASADAEQRDYETGINSAGVLDGGVDEITALQLWDTLMKKYKVAQLCDEELRRLDTSTDDSHAHGLLRERALAVATAVDALSKLQHKGGSQ